ncbi:N-acetylmuramoyl-L-alanine amidase family protein [Maribacter antarcticus]|uniref:N-acetylmuramoyl-L-alanine amidase family protein n=1 Tax=Maribacter antarcticus TaxID=505250 RepID=UPI00047AACC9|nr:N-acetylmuramoyl-L-alanine amidase [Maribacter antarcticus]
MKIKSLLSILFLASSLLLFSFTPFYTQTVSVEPFVVVLDAGHGGHDPGNLGNGYLEKNIALNIVLKVGELLGSNKDIKVMYTRKDDTFINLFVRGEIANKANADLFVSVHCDSHTSDAHGAGTFVLGLHANKQNFEIAKKENSVIYLEDNYETRYADYDINAPESVIGLTIMQEEFLDQSIALAKMIQDNFSGKLKRNDRKVKQAGFIVLHQTFMPSVLVETGFLTNKNEGAYLNSNKGQVEMGTAIANAILKYKGATKANTSPVLVSKKSDAADEPKRITAEAIEMEKLASEKVLSENKVAEKEKEPISATQEEIEVGAKAIATVPQRGEKSSNISTKAVNNEDIKVTNEKPVAEIKEAQRTDTNVVFKIQLMASSKDLASDSDYFNGLNRISKEPYKKLYRYLYGETRSHREAEMMKSKAASRGFSTAYIVAYRDGVRITISEALKEVSQ